ncbi:MAG: nucleotidyltransferase domain-containing protein [Candidatus Kapaibacteriales bacterium]
MAEISEQVESSIGLSPKHIDILVDIFREWKNIEKVLLFGSRAKGNNRKSSDVDLAVIGQDLSARDINRISDRIYYSNLPFKWDLINIASIRNPNLLDDIYTFGKAIYIK